MAWLYVPGLGDSKMDSNLHSDHLTDVSVTLNGKPTQPQSLLRAWRTKSWMRLLSGMTLDHMTAESGAELFRLSLLDSHANHFQPQVNNRALKTRAISGLTLKESSEKSNPNGASLRMSQDYSQPELLTTDTHTKSYQAGYISWVTRLRKDYSARMRLVRHIRGKDSSSWPTPKSTEINETPEQWDTRRRIPKNKMMGPSLTVASRMWPTPRDRKSVV